MCDSPPFRISLSLLQLVEEVNVQSAIGDFCVDLRLCYNCSDHRHYTGRPYTSIRRICTRLAVSVYDMPVALIKCPSLVTGDNPVKDTFSQMCLRVMLDSKENGMWCSDHRHHTGRPYTSIWRIRTWLAAAVANS